MNKVFIMGNLTRDPEVRVIDANSRKTSVVNFTVAMSRHFRKKNGEKDKETTFMPCEAWDTAAETIGKYLVKGSPILVEGALKNENWEQDGQKRSRTKVRVTQFEMLGGKRASDAEATPATTTADATPTDTPATEAPPTEETTKTDDVPF
jgi:single-strand DNA-binding protein